MPKLLEIEDRRPIDFDSGKRLPATTGDLVPCDRCQTPHAITWVVQDDDGGIWSVGSTCARRLFDGWTPQADEKRQALLRLWKKEEEMFDAEKERIVEDITRRLVIREMPEPTLVETLTSGIEIWGIEGEKVWVRKDWGETLDCPRVKGYLRSAFARILVREAAEGVTGAERMVSLARSVVEYRIGVSKPIIAGTPKI